MRNVTETPVRRLKIIEYISLTLVDQVGAGAASSGRERTTWARNAASSGGGAALDQRRQECCSCAQGQSQLRTQRSVAAQTTRSPLAPPERATGTPAGRARAPGGNAPLGT